jgi:hypothetical protein
VNSPGVLTAQVGNGPAEGRAYFFYDDETVPFLDVPLDTTGAQRSVLLSVTNRPVGDHVVRVSPDALPPPSLDANANKAFTVVASKDTAFTVLPSGTSPPMPDQPDRWVFQAYDFSDVNAVDTYVLPTNPSRMRRSFGNIVIDSEPTTVSNGKVISWEGAPVPPRWSFEGSVLTKDAYRQIVRWGQTSQRFYITDHLGHRYLVKVITFDAQRVRDMNRPWNHTYSMEVAVLQGTGVFTV